MNKIYLLLLILTPFTLKTALNSVLVSITGGADCDGKYYFVFLTDLVRMEKRTVIWVTRERGRRGVGHGWSDSLGAGSEIAAKEMKKS